MVKFAQLPKYEVYKDSGFSWVGIIPYEWEVSTLGSCLFPVSIKNHSDYPLLSITRELGVIERDIEDSNSNHNFIPDDLTGYKLLRQGQFGMNKMKAWQGSYGVSKFTGIVSPAYFVFEFTKPINPDYFNWAIRSQLYVSYFGSASDGVRIGQWDLSKSRMKGIPFLLPSEQEQRLIANFLDQKTAQIDAAIAIKEQQIELLKERKQIIIQQAVTQGLDPNVPMKDSGVEWIGQIPEHWEVKKLKHGLLLTNDKIESKKSQLKYLGMESVQAATGLLSGVDSEADGLANVFHSGQVLFGKLRPYLAKVYLAEFDGVCSTEFLVFEAKANYDRGYISKLLLSDGFIKTVDASTYGSKMPRANPNFILNTLLPSPPIIEQLQIHEYITNISGATESAIINTVEQIQKLKEYKTTLINSAVTGKIKITPEMLQA